MKRTECDYLMEISSIFRFFSKNPKIISWEKSNSRRARRI